MQVEEPVETLDARHHPLEAANRRRGRIVGVHGELDAAFGSRDDGEQEAPQILLHSLEGDRRVVAVTSAAR